MSGQHISWWQRGDGKLALMFEAPREVGGVELVEGDTTSEDVALTLSEDGETFQVWDGVSAATARVEESPAARDGGSPRAPGAG